MRTIILVLAALALAAGSGTRGSSPGPVASTAANGYCETFRRIWNAYPSYDYTSAQLVEDLHLTWLNSGGTANTCAIRMSLGLLGIGIDAGRESRGIASLVTNANVAGLNPPQSSGASLTSLVNLPNLRSLRAQPVLIRVRDLDAYVTRRLGRATWTAGRGTLIGTRVVNGETVQDWQDDRRIWGKAGIIMYTDCGWTDATGHWDLYNGRNHRGHGHADVCRTIKMWNVCGSAFDRGQSGGVGANTPTTRASGSGSAPGGSTTRRPGSGSSGGSGNVLCTTTSARVRASSSTSSSTVTILRQGTRVTTTRLLSNGWYEVSSPNRGFMSRTVLGQC